MSEAPIVPVEEPIVPTEVPVEEANKPAEPVVPEAPVSTETSKESDWTPVTENIALEGVKYGGFDVAVEIPADLANYAGEKGVDIQAVSNELYASPDFSLSQETLDGLYESFGKWQVDAYLDGIKAKNDAVMGSYKTQLDANQANQEAAWNETLEIMGGEDRWNDLDGYAQANLTEDELSEFNEVMEKGSIRMQKLMIKDLYSKFEAAGAPVAPNEPKILDLEEGDNQGAGDAANSALSSAEYLKLLTSGEYKKDPAKYDALRRLGMSKGI